MPLLRLDGRYRVSRPKDGLEPGAIRVGVHGPGVTVEDAMAAGVATKDLLHALGEQLGVDVEWQVKSVQFMCDGCGLLRPDRPRSDEGWTYRDGDDLCPSCSASPDEKGN